MIAARQGRAKFNPYKACLWFLTKKISGWDLAHCYQWNVKPMGMADDAIFSKSGSGAGGIAHEFNRDGVRFIAAKKANRLTGWNIMRRLLADAGKPDVLGLYIARTCQYFWDTIYLPWT